MNNIGLFAGFPFSTIILLLTTCTPDHFQCNTSVKNFLNENKGTIKVAPQINGRMVKSIQAMIYFRESHGGFQTSFGFENLATHEFIPLFDEVRYSDDNRRGSNDWLGSVEGGILGNASPVKTVELLKNTDYALVLKNRKSAAEELKPQNAYDAKTNFVDPVPDNDINTFTFYENSHVEPPKQKSLAFLNPLGSAITTIIGFEDYYKHEEKPDYNDIIIEMCLNVTYEP